MDNEGFQLVTARVPSEYRYTLYRQHKYAERLMAIAESFGIATPTILLLAALVSKKEGEAVGIRFLERVRDDQFHRPVRLRRER